MITSTSRYRDSAVVALPFNPDPAAPDPYTADVRNTIVPSEQGDWSFTFAFHAVIGGQRIEQIADLYYGDAQLWWQIADANSDRAMNWSDLKPGTLLRIPNV